MATWVRNGTGTLPSNTDADVAGTVELDTGTAPIDFNPDAVNSVRIQYNVELTSGTFTSPEDHTVVRFTELTLNGVGTALATGNDSLVDINNANPLVTFDKTDSPIATGFTAAQWETAELNPGLLIDVRNWTTFNQNMGPDGVLISVTSVVVTIDYTPAATNTTIDCDTGAYTIAGVNADLLTKTQVDTAVGAYVVAGVDADLTYTTLTHYTLDCDAGIYTVSGVDADLTIASAEEKVTQLSPMATPGKRYSFVAKSAGGTHYTLDCDTGIYTINGVAADLTATSLIDTEVGSYTIAGVSADLLTDTLIDTTAGAYSIVGVSASLQTDSLIDTEAGSYTVSGVSANLQADSLIDTETGTYLITGVDAELTYAIDVVMNAATGTYVISGIDADLRTNTQIETDAGVYSVDGIAANLQTGTLIDTDAGVYSVAGVDADLQVDVLIDTEVGTYAISGVDADLTYSGTLFKPAWAINATTIAGSASGA